MYISYYFCLAGFLSFCSLFLPLSTITKDVYLHTIINVLSACAYTVRNTYPQVTFTCYYTNPSVKNFETLTLPRPTCSLNGPNFIRIPYSPTAHSPAKKERKIIIKKLTQEKKEEANVPQDGSCGSYTP